MAHDVFLTYSSDDGEAARAACAALELEGVRVWMAPRDIVPGADWAASIISAINSARAMVLIFSSRANDSPQVKREVERAVNKRIPIIPFRIENVLPSETLEYLISAPHWLDAFAPGPEAHYPRLVDAAKHLIEPVPPTGSGIRREAAPPAASGPAEPSDAEPPAAPRSVTSKPEKPAPNIAATWTKARIAGAAIVGVIAVLIGVWRFAPADEPSAPGDSSPPKDTSPAPSPIDQHLAEIRRQPLLGYNLERLPEAQRTITIAVLSTGVSPELAKALGAQLQASSTVLGEPDPEDLHGLGTSTVALLAALAPSSKIHAIKIYSANGSGLAKPGVDGVRKAVADGADVIFMDCCGAAAPEGLTAAIEDAIRAGALVVAPAGNDGGTDISIPGALDGVLAVGALDQDGKPARFTNRSADILFAPGAEIATIDDNSARTRQSGTSLSATVASAIAAVVWSAKPQWSSEQIRRLLADTAVDLGPLDSRRPQAGRIRRLDLSAAAAVPAETVPVARAGCARDCRRTFSECNMSTVNDATSARRDACHAALRNCLAACG